MHRAFALLAFALLVATGFAIALVTAPIALASSPIQIVGWFGQVVGSGDPVRDARSVPAFHRITVNGSADVYVTVGQAQSLVIEGQRNIVDIIDTTVEDGTLTVGSRKSYTTHKDVIVHVTVPDLDGLTLHGSSDATIDGARGGNLDVSVHGSGDVTASGRVEGLTYNCYGSGDAKLAGLAVRDAVVRVRGNGDVRLNVSGTLDVEIAGSGVVRFTGPARVVHQTIRGSGSVSQV
jgi:hypothetical protein